MENIINLKSGNYEAKVNLSRGANLISLTNSKYNADILRTPDYSKLHNPYTYDMPSFLGFHTTFNMPFIKDSSIDNVLIKCGVKEYIERDENYLP